MAAGGVGGGGGGAQPAAAGAGHGRPARARVAGRRGAGGVHVQHARLQQRVARSVPLDAYEYTHVIRKKEEGRRKKERRS